MKCAPPMQMGTCGLPGGSRTEPLPDSCGEGEHLGNRRVTGRFQASAGTPTLSPLCQGLAVRAHNSPGLASWQDCTIIGDFSAHPLRWVPSWRHAPSKAGWVSPELPPSIHLLASCQHLPPNPPAPRFTDCPNVASPPPGLHELFSCLLLPRSLSCKRARPGAG